MTHPFDTVMPEHPLGQKHGNPHTEDNYGFLRGLTGDHLADVNGQVVWNDPKRKTKESGCHIMALHGFTAPSSGYRRIIDAKSGRLRKMTKAELHRQVGAWRYADVRRWRRGASKTSAHPINLAEVYTFLRTHGGTAILELKARAFAIYPWIMEQAVAVARAHNHAPWFKALSNMWGVVKKAANTIAAGGHFALIFGSHVRGRNARLARGRSIIRAWPPEVASAVHIW